MNNKFRNYKIIFLWNFWQGNLQSFENLKIIIIIILIMAEMVKVLQ
jgi:hypothetical protein